LNFTESAGKNEEIVVDGSVVFFQVPFLKVLSDAFRSETCPTLGHL
jgi:hypothetical protein